MGSIPIAGISFPNEGLRNSQVFLSSGAWRVEFPLRALQMQLNARETGIKGATILTALLANQDHEF
ncbi:MAG: hypothetical protein CMO60_07590 [Verrucomicrobiales bacterium]|nr:hypothetical protein [Verrucomicrobiales bacterium]